MNGPTWHWLGNYSLVSNYGRRPAVLTGRDLKQCDPATGLLKPFDPESLDGRLIATAPDLLMLADQSVVDRSAHQEAPEDAEVLALCERVGFGAVMDSAARQWRKRDPIGAFTIGHCVATVLSILAKVRGGV